MKEAYLFDIDYDPKSLLSDLRQRGFLFLTPKQVCSVTDKTWGMIRYAAYNYALDAYSIAGNLRFTVSAVEDYLDGVQESFESSYRESMSRREVYGAYALREGSVAPVVTSLKSHGLPLTAIDNLLDIKIPVAYDEQAVGETELDDFYGIDSLDLPDEMAVWCLADILQVPADVLAKDMKADVSDVIVYQNVYSYLVSKQLVNVCIGEKNTLSQFSDNLSGQQFLDF